MNGVLLNFSGHPLNELARKELASEYDAVFTPAVLEFDFHTDPVPQLSRVLDTIPVTLDGSLPVTIIPPGQSTVAVLLFTFLHGMLGHFPRLCYLEMAKSGVYLPHAEYEITLHTVRMAGRAYRSRRERDEPLPRD